MNSLAVSRPWQAKQNQAPQVERTIPLESLESPSPISSRNPGKQVSKAVKESGGKSNLNRKWELGSEMERPTSRKYEPAKQ